MEKLADIGVFGGSGFYKFLNNIEEIMKEIKKEAAKLIRKYGAENITAPDESVKEEIINRETTGFFDSVKLKQELRAYLKKESIYTRATKPYNDAKSLIAQAEAYAHYGELEQMYTSLQTND